MRITEERARKRYNNSDLQELYKFMKRISGGKSWTVGLEKDSYGSEGKRRVIPPPLDEDSWECVR